ncbi:hypothetical protein [Leptolyngbya sp. FACHB-16]|uniref:hypothetical protein n=1 Tax=unclassified Leptolyngbya TaxID=2650499 RepID=UPI001689E3A8|nr:hypothetical protein [Leptolyngbya sp. FACHB-16]MBD2156013.1 hypothetical protein [Leptolyngbya sp. FACHB-16]
MSAEETADILRINLRRLYRVCDSFDARNDDEWDLVEGEHFEWLSKNQGTRQFYEEGAMAIAKYLQETAKSNMFTGLLDQVIESLTNRRKHTRQMLVRRRVISEVKDLKGVMIRGDLVFLDRPKVIRILDTNGKGLNAAAKRERDNISLDGREPMEEGVHFAIVDEVEYWSQRGLVRLAQNMTEKLAQKSRKAWTEAVAEVYENAIEQQRKYLDSFDAKVQKAMKEVKELAKKTCQVSLAKQRADDPFDMHVHHLFDKSTRPDLAAVHENLLVMHEKLHDGFHSWHGSGSCEPQHFIEYLTTRESWRFKNKRMTAHLHELINKLERVQSTYESR